MKDFFSNIIEADFMPHGHCYFWKPEILWLNVGGDAMIMLAYYSIPFLLFYFAKKRADLTHKYVFMLFAAFIFACGTTHLIDIWTVWVPTYRLEGIVKVFTGIISLITAFVVYRSVPVLLSLPSQDQLKLVNSQLTAEMQERRRAQEQLHLINEELEKRVQERTSQVQEANRELEREIKVRKQAEHELHVLNNELKKTNAELDNFVYCASHDLKSPIFNIEGLVSVLREELADQQPAGVPEILGRLDKAVFQVNRTIHDLTEVTALKQKDEAGNMVSDLQEVIEEVKTSVHDMVLRTGATVETDLGEQPIVPMARKDIKSILYNLISNAIKYRSPARKPVVKVNARFESDYLVLSVQDNGIGVDVEGNEKKLFGLFRRMHDHVEGSGVGLYIVKRIVDNYNGTVEVTSALSQGTRFTVTLPLEKRALADIAE